MLAEARGRLSQFADTRLLGHRPLPDASKTVTTFEYLLPKDVGEFACMPTL